MATKHSFHLRTEYIHARLHITFADPVPADDYGFHMALNFDGICRDVAGDVFGVAAVLPDDDAVNHWQDHDGSDMVTVTLATPIDPDDDLKAKADLFIDGVLGSFAPVEEKYTEPGVQQMMRLSDEDD